MSTLPDSTTELRSQRDALNAKYDRLLYARSVCPGYDASDYSAELKQVAAEISQIDRALARAEIHIRVVVTQQPPSLACHRSH